MPIQQAINKLYHHKFVYTWCACACVVQEDKVSLHGCVSFPKNVNVRGYVLERERKFVCMWVFNKKIETLYFCMYVCIRAFKGKKGLFGLFLRERKSLLRVLWKTEKFEGLVGNEGSTFNGLNINFMDDKLDTLFCLGVYEWSPYKGLLPIEIPKDMGIVRFHIPLLF